MRELWYFYIFFVVVFLFVCPFISSCLRSTVLFSFFIFFTQLLFTFVMQTVWSSSEERIQVTERNIRRNKANSPIHRSFVIESNGSGSFIISLISSVSKSVRDERRYLIDGNNKMVDCRSAQNDVFFLIFFCLSFCMAHMSERKQKETKIVINFTCDVVALMISFQLVR